VDSCAIPSPIYILGQGFHSGVRRTPDARVTKLNVEPHPTSFTSSHPPPHHPPSIYLSKLRKKTSTPSDSQTAGHPSSLFTIPLAHPSIRQKEGSLLQLLQKLLSPQFRIPGLTWNGNPTHVPGALPSDRSIVHRPIFKNKITGQSLHNPSAPQGVLPVYEARVRPESSFC